MIIAKEKVKNMHYCTYIFKYWYEYNMYRARTIYIINYIKLINTSERKKKERKLT